MVEHSGTHESNQDKPPGIQQEDDHRSSLQNYIMGFGFAIVLTLASFWVAGTDTVYAPGIPVLLAVLAIGQMGVHLVFFLHITSAPDNTNNVLALAFGVFVVGLVVFGSMIIMQNLNDNMMPMEKLIEMQR